MSQEYDKRYLQKNRTAIYARNKAWKLANKEKVAVYRRRRYLATRERQLDTSRAWSKTNALRCRANNLRYMLGTRYIKVLLCRATQIPFALIPPEAVALKRTLLIIKRTLKGA